MTRHHRKIKKSRRMRGGILPLLYRAYSSATKKNQPLPTTPPTTPPPTTPTTSSSWFGSSTPSTSTSSSSSWFGSSTPSTTTTGVAAGTGTTSSSWFGSSTPSTSSSSSWFGSSTPTTSTTTTTGTGNSWFGGKRRRGKHTHRRHKRGGTPGWTPLTGIAAQGAPFSGETAKPQVWVGGKTKRRYRKKGTRRH